MSLVLENLVLPLADFTLRVDVKLTAAVTGLSGPSGAGKTSLLELIAGLRKPQNGRITLDDLVLTDVGSKCFLAPEKRGVGYVPQDLALFPHLDALANLRYGLRHDENGLLEKVVDVLELTALTKRSIGSLSGGEKQRVALGRALLAGPKILLLDEPLSNLDDRLKEKILPYLHRIRREFAVPMIYVTHSQAELSGLCDEILGIEQGELRVIR